MNNIERLEVYINSMLKLGTKNKETANRLDSQGLFMGASHFEKRSEIDMHIGEDLSKPAPKKEE